MTTIRDGQPQSDFPNSPSSSEDENFHDLRRTALLAEIGLNFAEMIHDLRQPLTGIQGFAQLIGIHGTRFNFTQRQNSIFVIFTIQSRWNPRFQRFCATSGQQH